MNSKLSTFSLAAGLTLASCTNDSQHSVVLEPEPETNPQKSEELHNCFFSDNSIDQFVYPATLEVKERIECVLKNPDSLVETWDYKSTGIISIDQFVCIKLPDLLKSPCYEENPYSNPYDLQFGLESYLDRHRQKLSEEQSQELHQAQQFRSFFNTQTNEICGLDYRYSWESLTPNQGLIHFVTHTFNNSEENFLKEKCK